MNSQEIEPPPMSFVDPVPPPWRRPLAHPLATHTGDLGFPDHHPARPGYEQKEDLLTPLSARQGYAPPIINPPSSLGTGGTGNKNGKDTFGSRGDAVKSRTSATGSSQTLDASSTSNTTLWGPPIPTGIETVSLAGPIYEKLKRASTVQRLESMAEDIENAISRVRGGDAQAPTHTYRPPTRTIHNPLMRANFLSALSDPQVPLSRLSKNVPHGIKGEGMLELGWERRVDIARMGWLIGVVGGLEVQSLRNRPAGPMSAPSSRSIPTTSAASPSTAISAQPAPNPSTAEETYTIEFTRVVLGWMKKHLNEIVPSSANTSAPIATKSSGVESAGQCLLDDEVRKKAWLEKQSLIIHLNTRFFLHPLGLLRWFTHEVFTAHLVPLTFVLDLLDKTRNTVLSSDTMEEQVYGRRLVRGCLERLDRVKALGLGDATAGLERSLTGTIKSAWMIDRQYFLSPRTWRKHKDAIRELVLPSRSQSQDARRLRMEADLDRLARTNKWLSMHVTRPVDKLATEGQERQVIEPVPSSASVAKVLDNIARPCPRDGVRNLGRTLFGNDPFGRERRAVTRSKIKDVLDWMTQRTAVDPRSVILGVAIIKNVVLDDFPVEVDLELDQAKERSRRYHLVSTVVLDWVKGMTKAAAQRSLIDVDPVVQVIGRLIRVRLFDYQDYLGYMISVGGRRNDDLSNDPFGRKILARLPRYETDESVEFQRRMLLHTADPEYEQREEIEIENVDRELRTYLADWLLDDVDQPVNEVPLSESGSSSVRWHVWTEIRPKIISRIQSLSDDGQLGRSRLPRLYLASMSMLDYELVFELVNRVATISASSDRVQLVCIQMLQRDTMIWDALDVSEKAKSLSQTLQGNLTRMISRRYIPSQAEEEMSRFLEANTPAEPIDPVASTTQLFREVVEIHRQPSSEAVDRLAEGLIREFPRDGQVGEQVWILALSGLADLDITLLQPEGENKAVEATVRLLQNLGEHCTGGMDLAFRKWARSVLRKPTVATVNQQSCSLLLELVAKRVITTRAVLEGLLLPLWRSMAAFVSSASQAVPEQSRFVSLLSRAIFRPDALDTTISLFTRVGLAADLELAFEEVNVAAAVVKHLPFLAIIAVNTGPNGDMALFLQELCQVEVLKAFATREEAVVREAINKSPFSWEGHHEARDLVETCVRDLLNASAISGQSAFDSLPQEWPSVTMTIDTATRTRIQIALHRALTHQQGDFKTTSAGLLVLLSTPLTMAHRSLLYDAFENTGLTTVRAFLVHALSYLCGLYEVDPDQIGSTPAQISARARDIVWMLACACTVRDRTIEDESLSSLQVTDSETLMISLAATLNAITSSAGSSASSDFVADGLRLATLGTINRAGGAEIGDADIAIRLYALLAESRAKDDMLVYLLDELPERQADVLLNHRKQTEPTAPNTTSPGLINPLSKEMYFNSAWENITTRNNDDPYEKTSLENPDSLNVAAFNPNYSWESAMKLPVDISSIMRRPPTERDLDTGTTMLPLFTRSRMYDLYDPYAALTKNEKKRDSVDQDSPLISSGRSLKSSSYGTGNDPIEIDDSPPSLNKQSQTSNGSNIKAKKRPYPQESPVKSSKKSERKGSTSSSKPIAPLRKSKAKKE